MKNYTLSEETFNAILSILGNMPYVQSANLIRRINEEIAPQLEPNKTETPEEAVAPEPVAG